MKKVKIEILKPFIAIEDSAHIPSYQTGEYVYIPYLTVYDTDGNEYRIKKEAILEFLNSTRTELAVVQKRKHKHLQFVEIF